MTYKRRYHLAEDKELAAIEKVLTEDGIVLHLSSRMHKLVTSE